MLVSISPEAVSRLREADGGKPQWFNLLGLPAAVVSVGKSPEGLPIGVQIVGRPYSDYSVCTIAQALQKVFSWQAPPMIGVGNCV